MVYTNDNTVDRKKLVQSSKLSEDAEASKTTVNDYRKDLEFQLKTPDNIDWDYFLEVAIKAKVEADKLGENMPAYDRSLNEIIGDALMQQLSP